MATPPVNSILNSFSPVTLEEMDSVRLMNRLDTKFVFSAGLLPDFLSSLIQSYKVLEIGQRRNFLYNTRYLDTEEMLFYHQHVTGKLARHKIRFRKYESSGITFFEIKKKTNKNRTVKWRIEDTFNADIRDEKASLFIRKHIPLSSFTLQPGIENKFNRVTLVGTETKERITFDHCISFSSLDGNMAELPYLAIAEIKSEGFPSSSPFVLAARKMGIKSTAFSKYCMGNALLRDLPKKNILKQKILLLNKIENEYSKFNCS
jgi:hypothetical protein